MRLVVVVPLIHACVFPRTETDTTPPDDTGPADDTGPPSDTGTSVDTHAPVDTGASLDTGDTAAVAVVWRDVSEGSHAWGGDSGDTSGSGGSIYGCVTVFAKLVTDQATLDTFSQDHGYGVDLTGAVDFLTEVAVAGYTVCGAGGPEIEVVEVRATGNTLEVDYHIVHPQSAYGYVSEVFNVIAVSGTHWTSLSTTTKVIFTDSGDSGSGP